jgi:hypothetical protein
MQHGGSVSPPARRTDRLSGFAAHLALPPFGSFSLVVVAGRFGSLSTSAFGKHP